MRYKILSYNSEDEVKEVLKKINKDLIISKEWDYFYSINDKKEVIAYASVEIGEKEYIIKDIFVAEECRYKSNGKRIVRFVINKALMGKIEKVSSDEKLLFGFLKKRGFLFDEKNDKMILDNLQDLALREREGKKVAFSSLIQNLLLALLKIISGKIGRSSALLSDGVHSLADAGTSFGILFGLYYSGKPADDTHPYGHEKIECIVSIILGIIIILTGFELGKWNVVKFIQKEYTDSIPDIKLVVVGLISMVVKYNMYRQKMKVGTETCNVALISDAKDSKSDIYSSGSIVLGIILSIYVNPVFDVILGFIVAVLILKEGIGVILETKDIILEKQDKEFIKEIENYIYENTSITNVHDMVMKQSGEKIFLTLHIRLDGEMTLYESHRIADELIQELLINFEKLERVTVHTDYLINK